MLNREKSKLSGGHTLSTISESFYLLLQQSWTIYIYIFDEILFFQTKFNGL